MERNKIACLLLLAAVLATMSLAGFLTYGYSSPGPQTVEEALSIASTPLQQRLYAASDKYDSAVEIASPQHVLYITYKDRSTEDVVMKLGSTELVSSQWYYAEQPGESGRRPYISRVFGTGNVLVSEKVQRLDGTLLKTTVVDLVNPGKMRTIIDFAADGVTHLREQVFVTPKCCGGETLQRDERWRDDAEHTLAYRNIFNVDETRTITQFDEHMNVLKIIEWPKYESIAGSSVKQYYPASLKLRLESSADYYTNTVKYYREDGTLEAIVKISSGSTQIEYYDVTGAKQRLGQYWFRTDEKKDGVVNSTYKIYIVTEFDGLGNQTRQQTFSNGKPTREELYNVTIDGVTYVELDSDYDEAGNLKTVRYWLNEVKYPPFKLEEHKPGDGSPTIPALNADSLRMQIQIDTDLPIPPPQRGGGY